MNLQLARPIFYGFLTFCWLFSGFLAAQEDGIRIPHDYIEPLDKAARNLAEKGRDHEALELVTVMEALGYPTDDVEAVRAYCYKMLALKRKPAPKVASAAQKIRLASRRLATCLRELDGKEKRRLACLILRLDDQLLDVEKTFLETACEAAAKQKERRIIIHDALRRARNLDIPLELSESDNQVIIDLNDKPGIQLRCGHLKVHTTLPEEKAVRIVRESLRALALSSFLLNGKLTIPRTLMSEWVLLDSSQSYARAVEQSFEDEGLSEQEASNARKVTSFYDRRGFGVFFDHYEARAEARLLTFLDYAMKNAQPCLQAGHHNWICLAYLGVSLPDTGWFEAREGGWQGSVVTKKRPYDPNLAPPPVVITRPDQIRRANAGLAGCRQRMIYLAERGEDPPWRYSMHNAVGKIRDDALIKATMVMEYLYEQGPILPLVTETEPHLPRNLEREPARVFEDALEMPLAEFEAAWRIWVVPKKTCLADRVDGSSKQKLSRQEQKIVDLVNDVRKQALGRSLMPEDYFEKRHWVLDRVLDNPEYREHYRISLDRSLCEGAGLHAAYLVKNPEQALAWPDIHEEYPDREGFTVQGALAGAVSLIATKTINLEDAVTIWMGGFYHRLPLLDPGLVAIGWGDREGVAVLDAGSLVVPYSDQWIISWPYPDMRNAPRKYEPELINPVPEVADPGELGYPITLQVLVPGLVTDIRMALFEKKGPDREVPCYYTTPSHSLNPDYAPENAYCLIPKKWLKHKTGYQVRVECPKWKEPLTWTFKTGS